MSVDHYQHHQNKQHCHNNNDRIVVKCAQLKKTVKTRKFQFFLYDSNILAQFLRNLAWNGENFGFSICQSGGKCFDPRAGWKKHVYKVERRLNFWGAGQIYQLHREEPQKHQQQKQKEISNLKKYWDVSKLARERNNT